MSAYTATYTVSRSWIKNGMVVIGAVFLIALAGRVSFPLPFTPVPVALQAHVCLLMAAMLGKRLGSLSVALFLLMGALGFPVFSLGGGGLPILLGPRGGYLVGYLLAAWLVETLIEHYHLSSPRLKTIAMGVGNLVIYACGVPQLALFIGLEKALLLGVLPFLAGDLFKLFINYRLMERFSTSLKKVWEQF